MSDWIDIKKELPPEGEHIILTNRYWCDYGGVYPGEWQQSVFTAKVNSDVLSGKTSVTHWMYMPTPPTI